MLKAILWKLGFEWAHLMRLLRPQYQRKVYYFTFGANLADSVLQQRKIKIFDAFDHALQNAVLQFSQPGFHHQHGYASADAAEGQVVYGKVYQILQSDARRMDYFEGEPFLKIHEKIVDKTADFEFYFYRTTRIVSGLKPTREYLDFILNAYQQMEIVPTDYIDQLASTEILETFLPLSETSVFIRNRQQWPKCLHSSLLWYERACQQFVEFNWNRSLVQWAIRY